MKPTRNVLKIVSALAFVSLNLAYSYSTLPDPSNAGNVLIEEGDTTYLVDTNVIYSQEVTFATPSEYAHDNVSLSFTGSSGSNAALTFDHANESTGYFYLLGYNDVELVFQNLKNANFLNNTVYNQQIFYIHGGINDTSGSASLKFKDISGNIIFSNNGAGSDGSGFGFSLIHIVSAGVGNNASLVFEGIGGDIIVKDHAAPARFLIHVQAERAFGSSGSATVRFSDIGGKVHFYNNTQWGAAIVVRGEGKTPGINLHHQIIFDDIRGGVVFENNHATSFSGGALALTKTNDVASSLTFSNIKNGITMIANKAGRLNDKYSGGAIFMGSNAGVTGNATLSFFNIGGRILFQQNEVNSLGGAIVLSHDDISDISIDYVWNDGSYNEGLDLLSFIGNKAERGAGAIYLASWESDAKLSVTNIMGDVLFQDNDGGAGLGGAIYARAENMINMLLSADGGDITFTGNTHMDGLPNAMTLIGSTDVQLQAQEGRAISFYDPIYMENIDRNTETNTLDINKEEGYTGSVVFSGEGISNGFTQDDYTSVILGDINIHNGTLRIEQGAVLGTTDDTDTITIKGGIMDIVGTNTSTMSTIAAQNINFEGGILRIGEHSRFDAVDIDMTQGLNVDLAYYLPAANTRAAVTMPHNGLQITADTLSMGGMLTIADATGEFYYTDRFWAQDTDFILFNTTEVDTINGTFDAILSELTGTSVVADPYQYQGEWSLELLDGQLVAHWTATGGIEEIRPEMDGTAMLNTLWSTASNVQAMGRAGASQMGVHRFRYGKDHNIWGQGLADFSSHGRRGDRDGYDYNGGGYAVGMDHRMGKHFVTGFGVGQLKGDNRSRGYNIKTSQDTFMGMLYTEYNHQLNKKNNLDIQLIGVYGNTTNKSRTTYNRGVSQGKWDNDAWMLDLYATWTRDLGNNWSLTPYIGLEYTIANQDGFTETGYAARRFNSDKMRNLAMPIGMGVGKLVSFNNGMHWFNELKVSYVPDLYRKNPETQAEWLDQEFTWYAKGVAPVRNAARIEYNSRLQLSQKWSLYGGYMYEGRRNATYHQVNLGASYNF